MTVHKKQSDPLRFTLEAFAEAAMEKLGEKPGITLELHDGSEVYVPHPATVTDDRLRDIERVQQGRDMDREPYLDTDGSTRFRQLDTIRGEEADPLAIRMAKAILGPEDHARLIAGGGKSAHVMQAWQMLTDKDSDPKADK